MFLSRSSVRGPRAAAAIAVLGIASLALAGCALGVAGDPEVRLALAPETLSAEARDHLVATFEADNPGASLVIEDAPGGVDPSAPVEADVLEMDAAQVPALVADGALLDIAGELEDLGGADLLPGLVMAASNGVGRFGVPLHADADIVLADPALVGEPAPTLDEFVRASIAGAQAAPGRAGILLSGGDDLLTFVWAGGGEVAVPDDGRWEARLGSEVSVAALVRLQDLLMNASVPPGVTAAASLEAAYCGAEAARLIGPGGGLAAGACAGDGAPAAPAVFALPGRDGGAAPVAARGSVVGIAAGTAEPELAHSVVRILLGEGFQSLLAAEGLVPARISLAPLADDQPGGAARALAAASARAVPATPRWAQVEEAGVLDELLAAISRGEDVAAAAAAADARIGDPRGLRLCPLRTPCRGSGCPGGRRRA